MPPYKRGEPIVSPLRYPGAKRRLAPVIGQLMVANGLRPKLFVESFAGGASVALQLLSDGLVDSIALGEADPIVAGFWRCVFDDTAWLVRWVRTVPVSLAGWKRHKRLKPMSDRDCARKCLYLNRTSFSGIVGPTGGPLGGTKQSSEYKIDCRFPRERLAKRICTIAKMRDKVQFVLRADWRDTVKRAQNLGLEAGQVFFYFDPPFYRKADRLYGYYFDDTQHAALAERSLKLKEYWVTSYDSADYIAKLYRRNGVRPRHVVMLYSAGAGGKARPEMVITNLPRFPFKSNHRTFSKSRE